MGRGVSQRTRDLLQAAREILERIRPASVRALCYQLFNHSLIASMEKGNTDRISGLITRAREDRRIPWEWIVQEDRAIEKAPTWRDPEAYARAIQDAYSRDKWQAQPRRILVVSEKASVSGTLSPVLEEFGVLYVYVGGYSSATRARDIAALASPTHPLLVLYVGDYDPSGMHMSEQDLPRRLASYVTDCELSRTEARGWADDEIHMLLSETGILFRRIALTPADCRAIGRRLSFAAAEKRSDARHGWFVQRYGRRCWELDAMNPNDLRARVQAAIEAEIEPAAWERYVRAEELEREAIRTYCGEIARISGLPLQ